jgi:hypothetical protein
MKKSSIKTEADCIRDWDKLTANVGDKKGCRVAIASHLMNSFGYTADQAIKCVDFNLSREGLS